MCGIIGFINSVHTSTTGHKSVANLHKAGDVMEQGLVACSLRGMDSTGVFQVDKSGDLFLHKMTLSASMFIQEKIAKRFIRDVAACPITVFHTRAATEGKISVNNAHPFMADTEDKTLFVGVHNGTLANWRTAKNSSGFEVDSEWAINRLAAEKFDAFEDFRGSWSFVYWDQKSPDLLHFARNKERPMWVLFTKSRRHAMFGSEPGMLSWIAQRNDLDVEDTVWEVPANCAMHIDVSKPRLELAHTYDSELPAPKTVYVPPSSTTNSSSSYSTTSVTSYQKDRISSELNALFSKIAAEGRSRRMPAAQAAKIDENSELPIEAGEIAPLTEDFFYAGAASTSERKAAEDVGLHGQVVGFTPLTINDRGMTGTITVTRGPDMTPGEARAFLRCETAGKSVKDLTESMPWVAIAGVYTGVQSVDDHTERVYVLAPLTTAGLQMAAEDAEEWLEPFALTSQTTH